MMYYLPPLTHTVLSSCICYIIIHSGTCSSSMFIIVVLVPNVINYVGFIFKTIINETLFISLIYNH